MKSEPVGNRLCLLTLLIANCSLLLYFGLLVNCVLPVKRTILLEFQLLLGVPPVFAGSIVSPLAFTALQGYQLHHLFLACHTFLLHCFFPIIHFKIIRFKNYHLPETQNTAGQQPCHASGKNIALDQNRTDDLILTMDMLCQLSYKGTIS